MAPRRPRNPRATAPDLPAPPLPVGYAPLPLTYPPAQPAIPAGWGPTPSDFTTWITNPFTFATKRTVFRAQQFTQQSGLPSGVANLITFDTVLEDPFGGWSAVGTGAQPAWSWLAPYDAIFEVTVSVLCTAVAQVVFQAQIGLSGAGGIPGDGKQISSANGGGATAAQMFPMVAGQDYVQGFALGNAGFSTDSTTPGRRSSMEITFLSL